jgi:hypothetical protein
MTELLAGGSLDLLRHFHASLETHFGALRDERARLAPAPPVFALEHDLPENELALLQTAVRRSVAAGAPVAQRRFWLPFVVYATEIGYGYEGDEYWDTFAYETPHWDDYNRYWFKTWFVRFAQEFGGVEPQGAWASHFRIIAWPITHAVLPAYLQRQFAQLLFDFRTGLSLDVLRDPLVLGNQLANRANCYSDRFRIFAQNTALMGHVAAALLSGDDEESPYLTSSTLDRVVEGLTRERQAREWLRSARQRAGQIRASGFQPAKPTTRAHTAERLPQATDPKLFLRLVGGTWRAYAELPDLTALSGRLPHLYENLRTLRGKVSGGSRPVPKGGLAYAGQVIRFENWPDPGAPFVQLEEADKAVNALLADQCVITPGPWWLFRRQGDALATEVKGRFVRPGQDYILVGTDVEPRELPWCEPVALGLDGATASELRVPEPITAADRASLESSGLATVSSASIRPVGIVASSWDGEGSAEWIAGEPNILEIRCTLTPAKCLLTVDGQPFFPTWPDGDTAILLALRDLPAGPHEVRVVLSDSYGKGLAEGSLAVLIRDPIARPDGADVGEGLRMRASPARPTFTELWDMTQPDSWRERASITIQGPPGGQAEFVVALKSDRGADLSTVHRKITLPINADAWVGLANWVRHEKAFENKYDDAEECVLSVRRGGLGFASLTCERGFRPLRWRFSTDRYRHKHARLSDRTDSGDAYAQLYTVQEPLLPVRYAATDVIDLPPSGGLLRGVAAGFEALTIAPTDPTTLLLGAYEPPTVPQLDRNLATVVRVVNASWMWATADLPADPFAADMQRKVLKVLAAANVALICQGVSAAVERRLASADDPGDHLDDLRAAVGKSPAQLRLAESIGRHLHEWTTPERLAHGFGHFISQAVETSGMPNEPSIPSLLLAFAALPGVIMSLPDHQREEFLRAVMDSPVLLRAARFAVVASRAINGVEPAEMSVA